jgi:hypothetical protein
MWRPDLPPWSHIMRILVDGGVRIFLDTLWDIRVVDEVD